MHILDKVDIISEGRVEQSVGVLSDHILGQVMVLDCVPLDCSVLFKQRGYLLLVGIIQGSGSPSVLRVQVHLLLYEVLNYVGMVTG